MEKGGNKLSFLIRSLTFTVHVFIIKTDLVLIRVSSHRAVRKWPKHCVVVGFFCTLVWE